ncbi:RHOD [Musa troglodytarum]|uniref:RHOD n=1 Tax=Musa troglodytarum TaxID=320322 RepID=A0A9E7HBW1_9LILI|nr:RHOD [Musa troglodytarum]
MASTCFSRSSLPLPLFPLLTRNVPMVAIRSLAPYRSMHPRLLSSATIPRPNHLSCIRSMASNVSAEEAGVPRSVPVAVAHELLKAGHRYLDVRTEEEFSGGHAVGAVNIPYMFKSSSGRRKFQ